jgi:mRNA interferase RelE/StbE
MSYSIEILPSARREWKKLDGEVKQQAVRKLERLLENPRVASARLSGMPDCYKVKLRSKGYRIIYRVVDERLQILIIAAGRRDAGKADVYTIAAARLKRGE